MAMVSLLLHKTKVHSRSSVINKDTIIMSEWDTTCRPPT